MKTAVIVSALATVASVSAGPSGQHTYCPAYLSTSTSFTPIPVARRLLARVPNSTDPLDPVVDGKTLAWGGLTGPDGQPVVFALTANDWDRKLFNLVKTSGSSFKIPRGLLGSIVDPTTNQSVVLSECPATPFGAVTANIKVRIRNKSSDPLPSSLFTVPMVIVPSCVTKNGNPAIALSWASPKVCGYHKNTKCWSGEPSCYQVCANAVKKGSIPPTGGLTGWSTSGSANPSSKGLGIGTRPYITSVVASASKCA